jgi:hypothetical protein
MNPFNKMNVIRYLERDEIDDIKWDSCISKAPNENIYAYTEYLDTMANNWDALVIHDYQAVLPLPWKKKMGFSYLYTPRFTSPLAIYGLIPETMELRQILEHIPKKFRLWDLNLVNDLSLFSTDTVIRKNHVLHLEEPYEVLRKRYRASYRSFLNQAGNHIRKHTSIKDIIKIAVGKKHIQGTNADDYARFQKLFTLLEKKEKAQCYVNYSETNDLLAAAVFFISSNRIYYMLGWNSEAGRNKGASHQLIDNVIREYAGKDFWLDFEGSDIPGIAFFFEGFGANTENYYYLRENRLPWWCAWIKK